MEEPEDKKSDPAPPKQQNVVCLLSVSYSGGDSTSHLAKRDQELFDKLIAEFNKAHLNMEKAAKLTISNIYKPTLLTGWPTDHKGLKNHYREWIEWYRAANWGLMTPEKGKMVKGVMQKDRLVAIPFVRYVDGRARWAWIQPKNDTTTKGTPPVKMGFDYGTMDPRMEENDFRDNYFPRKLRKCDLFEKILSIQLINEKDNKLPLYLKYPADNSGAMITQGIYCYVIYDIITKEFRGYVGWMNDYFERCGISYCLTTNSHTAAEAYLFYHGFVNGFNGSPSAVLADYAIVAAALDRKDMIARHEPLDKEWNGYGMYGASWLFILEETSVCSREDYYVDQLKTRYPLGYNVRKGNKKKK